MYIRRMVSVNSAVLKGTLSYDFKSLCFSFLVIRTVTVCQVILAKKLVFIEYRKTKN